MVNRTNYGQINICHPELGNSTETWIPEQLYFYIEQYERTSISSRLTSGSTKMLNFPNESENKIIRLFKYNQACL